MLNRDCAFPMNLSGVVAQGTTVSSGETIAIRDEKTATLKALYMRGRALTRLMARILEDLGSVSEQKQCKAIIGKGGTAVFKDKGGVLL